MNKLLSLAALGIMLITARAEDGWLLDIGAAKAKAKAENKHVLMDFNGSDWCGPCIALKKKVLSSKEFEAFAKDNLVLVDVDFPERKKLSKEQKKANDSLAKKYDVEGYPTIIVLSPDGKKVGETTGYNGSDAAEFIGMVKKWMGK